MVGSVRESPEEAVGEGSGHKFRHRQKRFLEVGRREREEKSPAEVIDAHGPLSARLSSFLPVLVPDPSHRWSFPLTA